MTATTLRHIHALEAGADSPTSVTLDVAAAHVQPRGSSAARLRTGVESADGALTLEELERRLRVAHLRLQQSDRLQAQLLEAERRAEHLQRELDARYRELAVLADLLKPADANPAEIASFWSRRLPAKRLISIVRRLREAIGARQAHRRIRASGLFDPQWYVAHYPDVAASGMDPLGHYLRFGAREGRAVGPAFDAVDYARRNPSAAGSNPLLHYLAGQPRKGQK